MLSERSAPPFSVYFWKSAAVCVKVFALFSSVYTFLDVNEVVSGQIFNFNLCILSQFVDNRLESLRKIF